MADRRDHRVRVRPSRARPLRRLRGSGDPRRGVPGPDRRSPVVLRAPAGRQAPCARPALPGPARTAPSSRSAAVSRSRRPPRLGRRLATSSPRRVRAVICALEVYRTYGVGSAPMAPRGRGVLIEQRAGAPAELLRRTEPEVCARRRRCSRRDRHRRRRAAFSRVRRRASSLPAALIGGDGQRVRGHRAVRPGDPARRRRGRWEAWMRRRSRSSEFHDGDGRPRPATRGV